MNAQVYREPISPEQIKQEINDTFTFNVPLSAEHATSCEKVQKACQSLADLIVQEVPEGRERTVAINNLLSAALFSRHGITRRQVVLMVAVAESPITPSPEQSPVESSVPTNPT